MRCLSTAEPGVCVQVHSVLSAPDQWAGAPADRQQPSASDQGTITNSWKERGGGSKEGCVTEMYQDREYIREECVSQVSCEKKIKLKIQYYHYYDFNQARMRGNLTLWCAERQNKPTHPLFNLWHMMCIMSVGSRRISHCMHQCRVVPCHAKKA